MKFNRMILAILIVTSIGSLAFGHDMWLEKEDGKYSIKMGHPGNCDTYESSRLKRVIAYTFAGKKVQLDIQRGKAGCSVKPDKNYAAITAYLDNKYWMNTTSGWKNHGRRKGLTVLKSGRSFKHSKYIITWSKFLSSPLGNGLEAVPMTDPTSLGEGDTLKFRVYYNGKPATKGVLRVSKSTSAEDTHDLVEVDGGDTCQVIIGGDDLHMIVLKYEVPVGGKEVVWHAASLTFETK